MRTEERRQRHATPTRTRRVVTLALLIGVSAGVAACRVNDDDLKRWETTEHGPDKLAAVITHDKYDKELRIEAAWSLVEMKKRGGQAVGVDRLLKELTANTGAKDRRDIVEGLWKKLRPKVEQGVTPVGDGKFADPSVVYKDATFSLYSAAKDDRPGAQKLEIDPKVFDDMTQALTDWAAGHEGDDVNGRLSAFETRLDNTAQQFGVEQVLRAVGVPGTRRLPSLLTAKNAIKSQRLDTIARVISDVKPRGNAQEQADYDKARAEASTHFARLLQETTSGGYVASVQAETDDALAKNPQGKEIVSHKNDAEKDPAKNPYWAYFQKVRDERLQYLFTLLKQVGGKPVTDALMALAMNKEAPKEQRTFSLAALEGNYDTTNDAAMNSFLQIAKSDAPDEVKHVALVRINAYSPDRAVQAYYQLFDQQNWKVRYDAATQILSMMQKLGDKSKTTPKQFIDKLPDKPEQKMGLGEPSDYGRILSQLPKEMNAKQAVLDALNSHSLGGRLTALGWFLSAGTKDDLPLVDKQASSKDAVPKCKEEDGCNWDTGCGVPKAGGKPGEVEYKPVTNVGDYVNYCVKPQIDARAKAPPAPADKGSDDKGGGDQNGSPK